VTHAPGPAPAAPDAPSAAAAPFRRFAALWFCYFAAIGAFNPYAPLWFKELGFSALAIGGIASLQAWSRVLAPYGWGWLGDHRGSRVKLIRAAALASVVFSVVLV
jgi:MFS transporter, PPP family, 3-phenylpropionic acid transporter